MDTKELGNLSPYNFDEKNKKNEDWKNNSKLLGDKGEQLACEYLVKKRFKILGRNYIVPVGRQGISFGEIDIIVKKKFTLLNKIFQILTFAFLQKLFNGVKVIPHDSNVIHFVEVKTIADKDGFYPEDRVDIKKQKKLRQLAEIWLKNKGVRKNQPYQIDVVGVTISNNSQEPKIDYFENVVSDV